jgi:hypothetical protein
MTVESATIGAANNKGSLSKARGWFVIATLVLLPVGIVSVAANPLFLKPPKPSSDGPIYENIAFHLSQGRGFYLDFKHDQWREVYELSDEREQYSVYLDAPKQAMPTTGRPPFFPVMIATIYLVIERGAAAFACVRILSALCIALSGGLAVALVSLILDRWNPKGDHSTSSVKAASHREGATKEVPSVSGWQPCRIAIMVGCLAATGLAASHRTMLSYSHDFLTEPIALLLTQVLIAFLVAVVVWQNSSWPILLGLATTLAGMILVRSLFVFWLPGVGLLLLILLRKELVRRLATATMVLAVTCLLVLPWWIRNCVVLERLMPLGTQGPITMLGGYCDEALASGGDWQPGPEIRLRQSLMKDPEFMACGSDTQRELVVADRAKTLVRQWIIAHWTDLPWLFVQRIVTHWNPYFGRSLLWKLLALVGAIWLIANRRPEAWVLVGLPVMNTLIVALLYTTGGRFLVPLYGSLFTLAGIGAASLTTLVLVLWRRFTRRKYSTNNVAI